MTDQAHRERLLTLIDASYAADFPAERARELNDCLIASAESRSLFLDYCEMTAEICFQLRDRRLEKWLRNDFGSLALAVGTATVLGDASGRPVPSAVASDAVQRSAQSAAHPRRRMLSVSLLTAAAAVFVALGVMALVRYRTPEGAPQPFVPGPAYVAQITALSGAEWPPGAAGKSMRDRLAAGELLKLQSGYAVVKHNSGAKVLLQGPAEYLVEGDNRGQLGSGRMTAVVPIEARDYVVATPHLIVVDLGTEFGVAVDAENEPGSLVEVFQGSVRVEPPQARARDVHAPIHLAGGQCLQSRVVKSGAGDESAIIEFVPSGNAFARLIGERYILPLNRDGGSSGDGNAGEVEFLKTVLADGPMGAWYLPHSRDGRLFNAAGAGLHGKWLGNPEQASEFDGIDDFVELRNCIRGDFTIELWLRSSSPSLRSNYAWEGSPLLFADVPDLGFNDWGLMLVNDRFAYFEGNPERSLETSTSLTDGRWHHVVATRSLGQSRGLKLYVNGTLEAQDATNPYPLTDSKSMWIGGAPAEDRYFRGEIAAVAVFDRCLEPREFMKHQKAFEKSRRIEPP